MKSSDASSAQSNSRANSDFAVDTAAPARAVVVFLTLVGGRKEAEVAGRVGMRDVIGAVAVRNVEVTRPAAVAGRAGGRVCDFFPKRTGGIGATRTACPRFEVDGAGCFT
jgi:hypothetical protein